MSVDTLYRDSQTIRYAEGVAENTNIRIGQWCRDCTDYIGSDGSPEYIEIVNIANDIYNESVDLKNTALRVGGWCFNALKYVGLIPRKSTGFYDLFHRAYNIKEAKIFGVNAGEILGHWFEDFLYYIDYSGDVTFDDAWIFRISVPSGGGRFRLYMTSVNIKVYWGDGEVQEIGEHTNYEILHDYEFGGSYEIMVDGNAIAIGDSTSTQRPYNNMITDVYQLPKMDDLVNIRGLLSYAKNLKSIGDILHISDKIKTSDSVSFQFGYFASNSGITSIPNNFFKEVKEVLNINTINCISMFSYTKITSFDFSLINGIKSNSTATFSEFVSGSNVSNVQGKPENNLIGGNLDISYFFYNCTKLTALPNGIFNNLDTSKNISINAFLYNCSSFVLSDYDIFLVFDVQGKDLDLGYFFAGTGILPDSRLFRFQNLTRDLLFTSLFYNTESTQITISNLVGLFDNITCTLNRISFRSMFNMCVNTSGLTGKPFINIKAKNIDFEDMFHLSKIPGVGVGYFDVSDYVENIDAFGIFRNCTFGGYGVQDTMFDNWGDRVTNVGSLFAGTNILGSSRLFLSKNKKITSCASLFEGCSSYVSSSPETEEGLKLWERSESNGYANVIGVNAFRRTNASDINTIPSNWK